MTISSDEGAFVPLDSNDIGPDAIITDATMDALYRNPARIAQGQPGAPRIQYGAIAPAAVGQGELKTAVETETLIGASGGLIATLAFGQYGFIFETDIDNSSASTATQGVYLGRARVDSGGAWTPESVPTTETISQGSYVTLHSSNSSTTTKAVFRYVNASPPYDLGDGLCGLFVFVLLDSNGSPIAISIAEDPVWAHNGPTNIAPDFTGKDGRKYKRIRRCALSQRDLEAGRCNMDEYLAAQREPRYEDVEITAAYKNADMALIPQPWIKHPQGTICLLDPVNTHELLQLHQSGEDVSRLLAKGYLHVNNRQLKRHGPPGIPIHAAKWRNS